MIKFHFIELSKHNMINEANTLYFNFIAPYFVENVIYYPN